MGTSNEANTKMLLKILWILCCFMVQTTSGPVCPKNAKFQFGRCLCNFDMVMYEPDAYLICEPCKTCPAGYESSHQCNNQSPYLQYEKASCKKCEVDHFSIHGRCHQCEKKCNLKVNEIQVIECNGSTNRKCKCKDGHYRDISSHKCTQRCSKCKSYDPSQRVPNGQCLELSPDMRCLDDGIYRPTTSSISINKTKLPVTMQVYTVTTQKITTSTETTTPKTPEATTQRHTTTPETITEKHTTTLETLTQRRTTTIETISHGSTKTKSTYNKSSAPINHIYSTIMVPTKKPILETDKIIFIVLMIVLILVVIVVGCRCRRKRTHEIVSRPTSDATLDTAVDEGNEEDQLLDNSKVENFKRKEEYAEQSSSTGSILMVDLSTDGDDDNTNSPIIDIAYVRKELDTGLLIERFVDLIVLMRRVGFDIMFLNHENAVKNLQQFCRVVFPEKCEIEDCVLSITTMDHFYHHMRTKTMETSLDKIMECLLHTTVNRQDVVGKLINKLKEHTLVRMASGELPPS